jgi:hypothetical protein
VKGEAKIRTELRATLAASWVILQGIVYETAAFAIIATKLVTSHEIALRTNLLVKIQRGTCPLLLNLLLMRRRHPREMLSAIVVEKLDISRTNVQQTTPPLLLITIRCGTIAVSDSNKHRFREEALLVVINVEHQDISQEIAHLKSDLTSNN